MRPYEIVKQRHVLEHQEYYNYMWKLNTEQARIVDDVVTRKIYRRDQIIYFLLTGGGGTGKTHTAKEIF